MNLSDQSSNEEEQQLSKSQSLLESQHHHLLHCLEKTTNHEFADEQYYEQSYLEGSLHSCPSHSPSLTSQEGMTGTCCTRRYKRNHRPFPNSSTPACVLTHPLTHTHPHPNLQELHTIHIQHLNTSRSSLNMLVDKPSHPNCQSGPLTTATISIPTPPATTPEGDAHLPTTGLILQNVMKVSAL
ncbi:hypothetical protein DPEC_G00001310 [Dallia pectoralis]|uniref:Uncharacterized protein n=1 Tax=Dallia pectoralis TaxID=75939 RepID=A0ACC2HIR8_DALPE|nr:hypothetical protein DPEC_G00001310 [Dallia pectoralis]